MKAYAIEKAGGGDWPVWPAVGGVAIIVFADLSQSEKFIEEHDRKGIWTVSGVDDYNVDDWRRQVEKNEIMLVMLPTQRDPRDSRVLALAEFAALFESQRRNANPQN